jgi:hypothetical protein
VLGVGLVLALASPAVARTYLNYGDGQVRYKPHRLVTAGSGVACGVWRAKHLRWRRWGERVARATGTLIYNSGEGGCARGELRSVRARFRFFRPRANCTLYSEEDSAFFVEPRKVFTRANIVVPSWPSDERIWRSAPADGFACDSPG